MVRILLAGALRLSQSAVVALVLCAVLSVFVLDVSFYFNLDDGEFALMIAGIFAGATLAFYMVDVQSIIRAGSLRWPLQGPGKRRKVQRIIPSLVAPISAASTYARYLYHPGL